MAFNLSVVILNPRDDASLQASAATVVEWTSILERRGVLALDVVELLIE